MTEAIGLALARYMALGTLIGLALMVVAVLVARPDEDEAAPEAPAPTVLENCSFFWGPEAQASASPAHCFWCNTDPRIALERHEGPHATWCPYYRSPEAK